MRRTLLLLGLAATLGVPAVAVAQPRGPQAATTHRRPLTFREASERLRSTNPDEVREGIDALTVLGTPQVVPPLVELIHSGLGDDQLNYVVQQLGNIGRPEAIEELSALLHHRRVAVRQRAIEALQQIQDPRVRPLLESGLRDSDADVRGAAARALGATRATASVELLVRAFERNVPQAAEAIGRLGGQPQADRLLEAVGRVPIDVLIPGFQQFLTRSDIADPVKVHIIEQLVNRSPTQRVKTFLQEWVDHLPAADRSRARARAARAIREISDAPAPPTTPTPPTTPAPQGGTP